MKPIVEAVQSPLADLNKMFVLTDYFKKDAPENSLLCSLYLISVYSTNLIRATVSFCKSILLTK